MPPALAAPAPAVIPPVSISTIGDADTEPRAQSGPQPETTYPKRSASPPPFRVETDGFAHRFNFLHMELAPSHTGPQ